VVKWEEMRKDERRVVKESREKDGRKKVDRRVWGSEVAGSEASCRSVDGKRGKPGC
jgi:hypothetical protein